MIEFYKTFADGTRKIDAPEKGCWISAIAPTQDEIEYLIKTIGVAREFILASLDEEETSHIDQNEEETQTLIIIDYPNAEEDDSSNENTILYTTLPLGVVFMKGYIITICLHDNLTIEDMKAGRIKGINTDLKTRFLLLMLLKIAQRFLVYLRQIDRVSSRTERTLHKSMRNKDLIQMIGLEKSLVFFSTSLKSDENTLKKLSRGRFINLYEEDEEILEDVMIEFNQATEMCNIYSNIISSTMDNFSNVISNNLNIVMKTLTIITIVMSIPNIIFGYYGMNVSGLPIPNFWFPIIVTAIACAIATFIFIKKDMFH